MFSEEDQVQTIKLNPTLQAGERVLKLSAAIPGVSCRAEGEDDGSSCPCPPVHYKILRGNEDKIFWLNGSTGDLLTHSSLMDQSGANFRLLIAAFSGKEGVVNGGGEEDASSSSSSSSYKARVKIHVRKALKEDLLEEERLHVNVNEESNGVEGDMGGGAGKYAINGEGYSYDEPSHHRAKRVSGT